MPGDLPVARRLAQNPPPRPPICRTRLAMVVVPKAVPKIRVLWEDAPVVSLTATDAGIRRRTETRDATVGGVITSDTGLGARTDEVTIGEGLRGHQRICLARRPPSDHASHVAANGARHACNRGGSAGSWSSPAALPADRVGVSAPDGVLFQGPLRQWSLYLSRRRTALWREVLSRQ